MSARIPPADGEQATEAVTTPGDTPPSEQIPAEQIPAEQSPGAQIPAEQIPIEGIAPPSADRSRPPAEVLAERLDNDRFFSTIFDFTFTKFVTRTLAGPVYVVGLVLIALSAVFGLITSLSTAIATHSFWGVLLFLFGLLLTVVGALLSILLLRVVIEMFVAIVSIAENTRPRKKKDLSQ
ncbi:MAG: hypothetical protein JWP70_1213 [Leifsonia sp.]|jgi:hypothetical protein|nr:hypothetical protein [Leifsonia sp.]MDQ1588921.1 hypothetical protein [Microbacteriaceae bacterium]